MNNETGSYVRLVETATHGRVLLRDAADGRPRGLLLGFHGYAESADVQLERLANIPGADVWMLASIQGLNRFYRGRGEEVVAGWMTRQDREQAIADNVRYVGAVVESVRGGISAGPGYDVPLPIVCAGFSQGVAMAFRAAVRGRGGSAGVIAVGGDVPPELLADVECRFPPVFLARGDRDEWYTAAKLDADAAALRSRGAGVDTLVFSGAHEWLEAVHPGVERFLRASLAANAAEVGDD